MALLTELAELCARQFWRLVAVFAVVTGAVAFALLSAEDIYEARSLLLFKLGREYIYVPDVEELGARAPDPGDLQLAVNAEMQILNGSELREAVVDRLDVAAIYPDLAGEPEARTLALQSLNDAISISLITGSYIVQLTVSHPDPQMAARIANELVDVYFERRRDIFRTVDADILRAQLSDAENEIAARERELSELLNGGNILSFETLRDIAVSEQQQIGEELLEVEALLSALDEQEGLIRSELEGIDPVVTDQRERALNPIVQDARSAELVLEAERRALIAQLGANHPQVTAIAREIEALGELAADQPGEVQTVQRTSSNPLWLQAQGDRFSNRLQRAEAEARRSFLSTRDEQNRERLTDMSQRAGAVELARQKLELQRQQVADLYTRLREATARERLDNDQTNIRIIEAATPPLEPVGAPKKVRVVIAGLLGGFTALAFLLASYFLRQSASSAAGIRQRAGVPVLGEIEYRRRRDARALEAV